MILGITLLAAITAFGRSKEFEASPDRVFEAAVKAVKANGVISHQDARAHSIEFVFAGTECHLEIEASGKNAFVRIVRSGGEFLEEKDGRIFAAIADDLAGRPIKPNADAGESSSTAADKNRNRSLPSASSRIKGTKEQVAAALIATCSANGFAIASDTEHQITFFKDFDARNVFAYILFGNYSPRAYRIGLQFMISADGDSVQVNTAAEEYVQNGFGGTVRYVITEDPRVKADLQKLLDQVRQRVEAHSN